VDPAPLDGRAGHDRLDGLTQPEVGVGDDQLHPGQPACLQAAQEGGPEGPILRIADGEAQHLAAAVTTHPGGDHDGLGDHPAVDPGLAVGGVDEHIGEALAGQGAIRKPATSASRSAPIRETALLEMPLSAPSARTRSSTLRVLTPCR